MQQVACCDGYHDSLGWGFPDTLLAVFIAVASFLLRVMQQGIHALLDSGLIG